MPFGVDLTCQTPEEINARILNTPLDFSNCSFVTPGAQHLIERVRCFFFLYHLFSSDDSSCMTDAREGPSKEGYS